MNQNRNNLEDHLCNATRETEERENYTRESASPRHETEAPPVPGAAVVEPSWQTIECTNPADDVNSEASRLIAPRLPSSDYRSWHNGQQRKQYGKQKGCETRLTVPVPKPAGARFGS